MDASSATSDDALQSDRPLKRQKISIDTRWSNDSKAENVYATPEPSHYAAERPDGIHLGAPSMSGLRTPLSDQGRDGQERAATKSPSKTVEVTLKQLHNTLLRSSSQSVGEKLREARLASPVLLHDDNTAALAAFARMKPLRLAEEERPQGRKTRYFTSGVHIRTEQFISQARLDTSSQGRSTKHVRTKPSKVQKSFKVRAVRSTPPKIITVPQYSYCVRLQDNILAPNIKMLYILPYHGDEFQPLREDYQDYYNLDIDERSIKLHRLQQAVWLFDAADSMVREVGISWQDVLQFFHLPIADMKAPKVVHILQKRESLELYDEECPQSSSYWVEFARSFPLDLVKLATAAHFCQNFQDLTQLSAWHVLRRSAMVREHFSDDDPAEVMPAETQEECRVCHRFSCHIHGELTENEPVDDDGSANSNDEEEQDCGDEPQSPTDDKVKRDLVNPPQVNFRKAVKFHGPANLHVDKHDPRKSRGYWESFLRPDEAEPPYPCHHLGFSCKEKDCSCRRAGVPCSKYCSCPSACDRKFQGCLCAARVRKPGEFVCFKDDRCACYRMGRECDPDLCGECGVCDVLSHAGDTHGRCYNASLQRGQAKHTMLGQSLVHELGLYAGEPLKHHDFIGEYKGEIITKEEANRRGAIYEHQKMSYLFSLNQNQEVDSTFFGNKMRFINHSTQHTKNVYAVIMMVNTVHRIALFAERPIEPGEELFFDYGRTFPTEQLGGKIVRKSAPKARNSELLDSFNKTPARIVAKKAAPLAGSRSFTGSGYGEDDDEDAEATDTDRRGRDGYEHSARRRLDSYHSEHSHASDRSSSRSMKRKRAH